MERHSSSLIEYRKREILPNFASIFLMSLSTSFSTMLSALKSACNEARFGQQATALSHVGLSPEHLPSPTSPRFAANINDAEIGAICLGIPLENMKWSSKSSPQIAVRSVGSLNTAQTTNEGNSEGFSTSIEVPTHNDSLTEHVTSKKQQISPLESKQNTLTWQEIASTVDSSLLSLSSSEVTTPQDEIAEPQVTIAGASEEESHAETDNGYHRLVEKNC